MDDIASALLGQLDTVIGETGKTLFSSTVARITKFFYILMTLLIVLLGTNMALGMFRISMRESMQIIFRIVLVMIFGLTWTNFEPIYEAATNGTQSLALGFFAPFTDAGSSATGALDSYSKDAGQVVDKASKATSSFFRSLVSGMLWVLLAFLVAIYVVVVGASKLWVAALLGFAPFAIMATIFDRTKNVFEGWLTTLIANLLYPVFCAAIVGTIVTANVTIFKGVSGTTTLGSLMSFVVLNAVGIIAISKVPSIAHGVTGSFAVAGFSFAALVTPATVIGKFMGMTYTGRKLANRIDAARERLGSRQRKADFSDYGGQTREEHKMEQAKKRAQDLMRVNHQRNRLREELRKPSSKK